MNRTKMILGIVLLVGLVTVFALTLTTVGPRMIASVGWHGGHASVGWVTFF